MLQIGFWASIENIESLTALIKGCKKKFPHIQEAIEVVTEKKDINDLVKKVIK